jgi:hypothetical protein
MITKTSLGFVAALALCWNCDAQLNLSISATPAAPGETTIASLIVENAAGFAGADISISLPEFISAGTPETVTGTSDFLIASRAQPGRVDIALARSKGLPQFQGPILQIPLRLKATAPVGSFPVTFTHVQVYNSEPAILPAKATDGLLKVVAPAIDLDKDGLPDEWEMQHFGGLARSPNGDLDGDGVTDSDEFLAGTDPAAVDSVFRVFSRKILGQTGHKAAVIEWEPTTGKNYEIHWSNGPLAPGMAWHRVYNPDLQKTGAHLSWTDDGTRTHTPLETVRERFYRVVIAPGPE